MKKIVIELISVFFSLFGLLLLYYTLLCVVAPVCIVNCKTTKSCLVIFIVDNHVNLTIQMFLRFSVNNFIEVYSFKTNILFVLYSFYKAIGYVWAHGFLLQDAHAITTNILTHVKV